MSELNNYIHPSHRTSAARRYDERNSSPEPHLVHVGRVEHSEVTPPAPAQHGIILSGPPIDSVSELTFRTIHYSGVPMSIAHEDQSYGERNTQLRANYWTSNETLDYPTMAQETVGRNASDFFRQCSEPMVMPGVVVKDNDVSVIIPYLNGTSILSLTQFIRDGHISDYSSFMDHRVMEVIGWSDKTKCYLKTRLPQAISYRHILIYNAQPELIALVAYCAALYDFPEIEKDVLSLTFGTRFFSFLNLLNFGAESACSFLVSIWTTYRSEYDLRFQDVDSLFNVFPVCKSYAALPVLAHRAYIDNGNNKLSAHKERRLLRAKSGPIKTKLVFAPIIRGVLTALSLLPMTVEGRPISCGAKPTGLIALLAFILGMFFTNFPQFYAPFHEAWTGVTNSKPKKKKREPWTTDDVESGPYVPYMEGHAATFDPTIVDIHEPVPDVGTDQNAVPDAVVNMVDNLSPFVALLPFLNQALWSTTTFSGLRTLSLIVTGPKLSEGASLARVMVHHVGALSIMLDRVYEPWKQFVTESLAMIGFHQLSGQDYTTPPVVDWLKSSVTSARKITTGPLAQNVSSLMALTAMFPVLIADVKSVKAQGFNPTLNFSKTKAEILRAGCTFESAMETFMYWIEFSAALVITKSLPLTINIMEISDDDEWAECLKLGRSISIGNYSDSGETLETIRHKYLKYIHKCRVVDKEEKVNQWRATRLVQMTKLLQDLDCQAGLGAAKAQPFAITILGPAGIGKSALIPLLSKGLHLQLGIEDIEHISYIIEGSKFDDQVTSATTFLAWDDASNIRADKRQELSQTKLLRHNGSVAVPLLKAELAQKGNCFNHAKFFCITTNSPDLGLKYETVDPNSGYRRMGVVMDCTLKPEYELPGRKILDNTKVDASAVKFLPPWLTYQFYYPVHNEKDDSVTKSNLTEIMDEKQAMDYIFARLHEHETAQKNAMSRLDVAKTMKLCGCEKRRIEGLCDSCNVGHVAAAGVNSNGAPIYPEVQTQYNFLDADGNFSFWGATTKPRAPWGLNFFNGGERLAVLNSFADAAPNFLKESVFIAKMQVTSWLYFDRLMYRWPKLFYAIRIATYKHYKKWCCLFAVLEAIWVSLRFFVIPSEALLFCLPIDFCFGIGSIFFFTMEVMIWWYLSLGLIDKRSTLLRMVSGGFAHTEALISTLVRMLLIGTGYGLFRRYLIRQMGNQLVGQDKIEDIKVPPGFISLEEKKKIIDAQVVPDRWTSPLTIPPAVTTNSVGCTHEQLRAAVMNNTFKLHAVTPCGKGKITTCVVLDNQLVVTPMHTWYGDRVDGETPEPFASLTGDLVQKLENGGIIKKKIKLNYSTSYTVKSRDLVLTACEIHGSQSSIIKYLSASPFCGSRAAIMLRRGDDGEEEDSLPLFVKPAPLVYNVPVARLSIHGFSYPGQNLFKAGDCMSPIISHGGSSSILGFHICGSNTSGGGTFSLLGEIQEGISKMRDLGYYTIALETLTVRPSIAGKIVPLSDEVHPKNPINFLPDMSVATFLKEYERKFTGRSDLQVNPIKEMAMSVFGLPDEWRKPNMNFNKSARKPLILTTSQSPPMDPVILQKCVADFLEPAAELIAQHPKFKRGPLTVTEALNGVPGSRFINCIKGATSAGFFLNCQKKKLLDGDPGDYTLVPKMQQLLLECQSDILKGFHSGIPVEANAKSEPRSIEKSETARIFYATPITQLIMMMQQLGPVMDFMQTFSEEFEHAIGQDCGSAEWGDRQSKTVMMCDTSRGTNSDFSTYDQSISPQMKKALWTVFKQVMILLEYSAPEIYMAEATFSELILPMVNWGGAIVVSPNLWPSGAYPTALGGSIMNSLFYRYSLFTALPEAPSFRSLLRIMTLGDDNKGCALKGADLGDWNMVYHMKVMESVGMQTTPAEKQSEMQPWYNYHTTEFLQRMEHYNGYLGHVVSTLKPKSIMRSLMMYEPTKGESLPNQLNEMFRSVMEEYTLYGMAEYDFVRAGLSSILKMSGFGEMDFLNIEYIDKVREHRLKYLVEENHSCPYGIPGSSPWPLPWTMDGQSREGTDDLDVAVTEQGISTIAEPEETASGGMRTVWDPSLQISTVKQESLSTYLSRQVKIGSILIEMGQYSFTTIDPLAAFIDFPTIAHKLKGCSEIQAGMQIRFVISGSSAHSGLFMASYLHDPIQNNRSINYTALPLSVVTAQRSTTPNVLIQLGNEQECILNIPYINRTPTISLYENGYRDLVQLNIHTVVPANHALGSQNKVLLNIFANLTNPVVIGSEEFVGQVKSEAFSSKVSALAGIAHTAAGLFAATPNLALPSEVAGVVLDGVAGAARYLGYSRPAMRNMTATVPMVGPSLSAANVDLPIKTLSLDCDQGISVDGTSFGGMYSDELAMDPFISKPCITDVIRFDSTKVTGTLLKKVVVTPVLQVADANHSVYTPAGWVGTQFGYWCGYMTYKIRVVTQDSVGGHLFVFYAPNKLDANPTVTNNRNYQWDLRGNKEITVRIGWNSHHTMLETMQSGTGPWTTDGPLSRSHHNGEFGIYILNPLVGSGDAPAEAFLVITAIPDKDTLFMDHRVPKDYPGTVIVNEAKPQVSFQVSVPNKLEFTPPSRQLASASESPAQAPFGPIPPSNGSTEGPTSVMFESPSKGPITLPPAVAKTTVSPTVGPHLAPTGVPHKNPTGTPFAAPTGVPHKDPTHGPSLAPVLPPTKAPVKAPTRVPTKQPVKLPTSQPTTSCLAVMMNIPMTTVTTNGQPIHNAPFTAEPPISLYFIGTQTVTFYVPVYYTGTSDAIVALTFSDMTKVSSPGVANRSIVGNEVIQMVPYRGPPKMDVINIGLNLLPGGLFCTSARAHMPIGGSWKTYYSTSSRMTGGTAAVVANSLGQQFNAQFVQNGASITVTDCVDTACIDGMFGFVTHEGQARVFGNNAGGNYPDPCTDRFVIPSNNTSRDLVISSPAAAQLFIVCVTVWDDPLVGQDGSTTFEVGRPINRDAICRAHLGECIMSVRPLLKIFSPSQRLTASAGASVAYETALRQTSHLPTLHPLRYLSQCFGCVRGGMVSNYTIYGDGRIEAMRKSETYDHAYQRGYEFTDTKISPSLIIQYPSYLRERYSIPRDGPTMDYGVKLVVLHAKTDMVVYEDVAIAEDFSLVNFIGCPIMTN